MGCVYLKKKLNNQLYCKLHNKCVNISDCSKCADIIYKSLNTNTLKKITFRQIEKQKKRFSIIYHNLNVCCVCGLKSGKYNIIDLNEIYEGSRRQASMVNGFVAPMCRQCHTRFHNDREFALKYKKMFQREYEKTHTRQEFINLIHKSYL